MSDTRTPQKPSEMTDHYQVCPHCGYEAFVNELICMSCGYGFQEPILEKDAATKKEELATPK